MEQDEDDDACDVTLNQQARRLRTRIASAGVPLRASSSRPLTLLDEDRPSQPSGRPTPPSEIEGVELELPSRHLRPAHPAWHARKGRRFGHLEDEVDGEADLNGSAHSSKSTTCSSTTPQPCVQARQVCLAGLGCTLLLGGGAVVSASMLAASSTRASALPSRPPRAPPSSPLPPFEPSPTTPPSSPPSPQPLLPPPPGLPPSPQQPPPAWPPSTPPSPPLQPPPVRPPPPSSPPHAPPPPLAPLVGWANNRWEYGTPSNDLAAAGVLAHVLDGEGIDM